MEIRSNAGAAVLAGGQSRRMGRDKAMLLFHGETLLAHACRITEGFGDRLLSVDRPGRYPLPTGMREVPDAHPGGGAMVGLLSALEACRYDRLVLLAVDMPLLTAAWLDILLARMPEGADILLPQTRDGRLHPLCAVYHRRLIPRIRAQLAQNNRRMQSLLDPASTLLFPLEGTPHADTILVNPNTPEMWQALLFMSEE